MLQAGKAITVPCASSHLVKYVLQLVLCQSAALNVLNGTQGPGHGFAIRLCNRAHLLFCELVLNLLVISQIDLSAHYEARHARAMMVDLWKPFLLYVLERGRRRDREANEENIRLRV